MRQLRKSYMGFGYPGLELREETGARDINLDVNYIWLVTEAVDRDEVIR